MTRVLGSLAALLFVLSACGSDEDDFRDQLKANDPSITDEMVDCLIEELDVRGLTVTDISDDAIGDGPVPEGGQDAFLTCLAVEAGVDVPDADDPPAATDAPPTSTTTGSSGDSGTPGAAHTYGDNPDLDELWDGCEAGDGAACDDLYFRSDIGSDYENFGDTCGRRYEESPGFCEDVMS